MRGDEATQTASEQVQGKLPPFPDGWYAICFSADLSPGQVRAARLSGRDLVVYRTAAGRACVSDAHCPHMGAHFAHGGSVQGETLRCPFHGFAFDPAGRCTETGYGTRPPRTCQLRVWKSVERNGAIHVWYQADAGPPSFELPPEPDGDGWLPLQTRCFELRSHPQETTENSADIGHFDAVHGYADVQVLAPLAPDGPTLSARYSMLRQGILGRGSSMRLVFDIWIHGLGYSFVDVRSPEVGLRTRQYVFATPVDVDRLELRIAMQVRAIDKPSQLSPLLSMLPARLLNRVLPRLAFKAYVDDVSRDFEIWQHKAYCEKPALAQGDGPVAMYRRWASQFYAELRSEQALERIA